jgi:hypothetical protein
MNAALQIFVARAQSRMIVVQMTGFFLKSKFTLRINASCFASTQYPYYNNANLCFPGKELLARESRVGRSAAETDRDRSLGRSSRNTSGLRERNADVLLAPSARLEVQLRSPSTAFRKTSCRMNFLARDHVIGFLAHAGGQTQTDARRVGALYFLPRVAGRV